MRESGLAHYSTMANSVELSNYRYVDCWYNTSVHKVILLPRLGSATLEARVDMGEKVIINIKTMFDGHRPPDRVLPLKGA